MEEQDLATRIKIALGRKLETSFFWQSLFGKLAANSTVSAAKAYPYADSVEAWWTEFTPPPDATLPADQLPVPPPDLWEGYGRTPNDYLGSGKQHTARMLEVLGQHGFAIEQAERVLDFGCASGRMLRWLAPHAVAPGREYWGVDIGSKSIHWAAQHLSPPFFFFNNTTLPPLPFDGGTFDLIYCGSVFSHISDLADLWLLELRRLLKSGGYLYATVQDRTSAKLILDPSSHTKLSQAMRDTGSRTGCFDARYAKLVVCRSPKTTMVFYDIEHLRQRWGRFFEVVAVVEKAYGFQTAVVLRKR